ncbi:MAG TPA: TIGR00645 family protein [Mariprofundaceae bacterium]|nr:TIGR00645 family protein [Mariprofundaceae bacterium]
MLKAIENALESLVFRGRWLLAPMYLGLVGGLALLLVKFAQEFAHIVLHVFTAPEREIVLSLLALIDITLVASLLVIVIFSGYENFVSKIDVGNHEDRPSWMGKVDFSGLKIKLIGSIVAISAIDLLKAFMNLSTPDAHPLSDRQMGWMLAIHGTFIVSGVLFALMDRLAEEKHG